MLSNTPDYNFPVFSLDICSSHEVTFTFTLKFYTKMQNKRPYQKVQTLSTVMVTIRDYKCYSKWYV